MMKPLTQRWILAVAFIGVAVILLWAFFSGPGNPIAQITVVDAAGKPVAGAVIQPRGLRTKSGPYQSGWYGWNSPFVKEPNAPVTTDKNGHARIGYPKYVFEKIETGVIIFSVNHPDFVPDNPERVVATSPPAGTPWRMWADYLLDRIRRHKQFSTPVDPVVLQRGSILKLSDGPGSVALRNAPLFVQVSGNWTEDSNSWLRPEPGVIMTRRLRAGAETVRAVQFDAKGAAWFSEAIAIEAVSGHTNDLVAEFARGVSVRGELDSTVPRPVKNGRVIAHVWPLGCNPQTSPPEWHAWAKVCEDGSFEVTSLPQGDLELVALCNGFVSTNGPGKFHMRYPQKHVLGTNDLAVTIGMEPTARLEIRVTDDHGKPVKGARVSAWPNVRYGEWAAVVLAQDCYKTSDGMLSKSREQTFQWWSNRVSDFEGTSDDAGLAVISNVPADVTEIGVEHPQFALPAILVGNGQKRREAVVKLTAGITNHTSIQLEPTGQSPIAHY